MRSLDGFGQMPRKRVLKEAGGRQKKVETKGKDIIFKLT